MPKIKTKYGLKQYSEINLNRDEFSDYIKDIYDVIDDFIGNGYCCYVEFEDGSKQLCEQSYFTCQNGEDEELWEVFSNENTCYYIFCNNI